jgi:hypothetical protein
MQAKVKKLKKIVKPRINKRERALARAEAYDKKLDDGSWLPFKCCYVPERGKKKDKTCLKPCTGRFCKRHKDYETRREPNLLMMRTLESKLQASEVIAYVANREYERDRFICKLKRKLAEARYEVSSLEAENKRLKSSRDGNHCKQRDKRMSKMQLHRKRLKSRSTSTKGTAAH